MNQDKATVLFTEDLRPYCYQHSNSQLFLFSKSIENIIFEVMPKDFTISTQNTSCQFNIEMLKETSPTISLYIHNHPNEKQYTLQIFDEKHVLNKFEQLYQGKNVFFENNELSTSQTITQLLQIQNCPNCLKPPSLRHWTIIGDQNPTKSSVIIHKQYLLNFLREDRWKTFKIRTKRRNYNCNIFGVYTSDSIRRFINENSLEKEFFYDFDDENDEFQLICDFFNFKIVYLKSENMNTLKSICEDLQINCIIPQIDDHINFYEKTVQEIDKKQTKIDSFDNLFDIFSKIKYIGIDKVKFLIIQSKWYQNKENIQELAAYILQVIKPSFSLQKEMAELLIELSKEETNKFNLLITTIVDYLLNVYMPRFKQFHLELDESKIKILYEKIISNIKFVSENISMNNKCVYSFIRILYKRGLIQKERIVDHLTNYDCLNPYLNAFFLPELIELNPLNVQRFNDTINNDYEPSYKIFNYVSSLYKKYFPNKINLYEQMIDNIEPDDELTKSIRNDDIDTLKSIIVRSELDIRKSNVPYNIFDDFDEDISLINYAALYGSLKCFKYLLLNGGNIDETSFYFAISGANIEIIKIVEQKCPYSSDKIIFDEDISSKKFWFDDDDKENNLQYSRKIDDVQIESLNFYNINNIIAPTIAMHKNELFDWLLENNLVLKGDNKISFDKIAILSAMSGDSHSLIELINRGLISSSNLQEIVFYSAKNGFYKLTKLLMNFLDDNIKFSVSDESSLYFTPITQFGSVSIFSLFFKKIEQSLLERSVLYAILMNYKEILNYFFENYNKLEFTIINESFIELAFTEAFERTNDELFNFLYEKFQQINPELFTFELFKKLLINACNHSYLFPVIIITEKILEFEPKYDFTAAFIASETSDLMKFFIDKKVFINYLALSSNTMKLASVDVDIFKLFLSNANPYYKYKCYNCIYGAIKNENIKLIDFLLKENKPNDYELFEAINIQNIKIVDLVLKYNSEPSFVNLLSDETALCHAVSLKCLNIVKRLLSVQGIDPSIYGQQEKNALTESILLNDIDIIDAILNFYDNEDEIHINTLLIDDVYNRIGTELIHHQFDWTIFKRFLKSKLKPSKIYFNDLKSGKINSFLILACLKNEFEVVENLLKLENVDINLYDIETGNTPLMIAIENKNTQIAEFLIKNPKININWLNRKMESAITIAVKNDLIEIVDLLLKNERFNPNESRLNISFVLSKGEISKKLCSLNYLNVNQYVHLDFDGKTNALIKSVEENDIEKVDLIINHSSFDKYKSDINRAILIATKNNNINIFRKLIQLNDNDINIINEEGQNLLLIASIYFNLDIMNEIFKNPGFDSKAFQLLNVFIQTFFKMLEINKMSIEVLNSILEYDKEHEHLINMNEILPNGQTFLTSIEFDLNGIKELTNFLIKKGCDPNKPDENNIYPLEKSIVNSSITFFNALLNSGFIKYNECEKGYLNVAVSNRDTSFLEILLEKIEINSANSNGETALIEACKYGNILAIDLLFNHDDLDYLHRDKNGNDALETLIQLVPENKQNKLDDIIKSSHNKKQDESKRRQNYHNKLISIISMDRSNDSFKKMNGKEWENASDDDWF